MATITAHGWACALSDTDADALTVPCTCAAPEAQLVWTSDKTETELNHGLPMTPTEALAYAHDGNANSHSFEQTGWNRITWVGGLGTRFKFTGMHPMPTDVHAAIYQLDAHLRGLGWADDARALLVKAAQAAVDGDDHTATNLLKQVIATPITGGGTDG